MPLLRDLVFVASVLIPHREGDAGFAVNQAAMTKDADLLERARLQHEAESKTGLWLAAVPWHGCASPCTHMQGKSPRDPKDKVRDTDRPETRYGSKGQAKGTGKGPQHCVHAARAHLCLSALQGRKVEKEKERRGSSMPMTPGAGNGMAGARRAAVVGEKPQSVIVSRPPKWCKDFACTSAVALPRVDVFFCTGSHHMGQ